MTAIGVRILPLSINQLRLLPFQDRNQFSSHPRKNTRKTDHQEHSRRKVLHMLMRKAYL